MQRDDDQPRPRRRGVRSADRRPTCRSAQLVRISLYWLGLTAIVGGVGVIHPGPAQVRRVSRPDRSEVTTLAFLAVDRRSRHRGPRPADGRLDQRLHVSRWGRRKPYIVIGSLLDVVFLVGHRDVEHVLIAIAAFVRPAPVQHELRAAARSRATSPISSRRRRSGWRARWSG